MNSINLPMRMRMHICSVIMRMPKYNLFSSSIQCNGVTLSLDIIKYFLILNLLNKNFVYISLYLTNYLL